MPDRLRLDAAPARARFGTFWRNDVGKIVEMDAAAEALIGYSLDEVRYRDATDQIHPEDRENAFENWIETLSSPGVPRRWRCRHECGDGGYLWVEITNTNLLNDPEHELVLSEMMDITEEMDATERLREREELLQRLAESLPSGILQVDARGEVVYTNSRLHEIVGVGPEPRLAEQFASAAPDDRRHLAETFARVIRTGEPESVDLRLGVRGEGRRRVCLLAMGALRAAEGHVSGAVITVADVTEASLLRQQLEQRANLDPLTGCANRGATLAALERILDGEGPVGRGAAPGAATGVVFIDLDQFKPINDRFGHAAGDEVLVAAAERLRAAVRNGDLVGRLGGDEFVILCPGAGDAEVAMAVAERVTGHLCRPLTLSGGAAVDVRASVGVAWSARTDLTAEQLIGRADAAMYDAKRRRDGRPVLIDHNGD